MLPSTPRVSFRSAVEALNPSLSLSDALTVWPQSDVGKTAISCPDPPIRSASDVNRPYKDRGAAPRSGNGSPSERRTTCAAYHLGSTERHPVTGHPLREGLDRRGDPRLQPRHPGRGSRRAYASEHWPHAEQVMTARRKNSAVKYAMHRRPGRRQGGSALIEEEPSSPSSPGIKPASPGRTSTPSPPLRVLSRTRMEIAQR